MILNVSNIDINTNGANKLVARGIQEIYGNGSLFINQMPSEPKKLKNLFQHLLKLIILEILI